LKTVLHVGAGYAPLPEWLAEFSEVRLDIDPECKPHIVASMLELGDIGPYDAVLANHCVEHLYPHEVEKALSEFRRVLKPGGFASVFVPDLEDVRPTDEILYESPAGPIAGLDMFYGHRKALAAGMIWMAHHTGFTEQSLKAAMEAAGFTGGTVARLTCYGLMAVGFKAQ
jgi:SAM-dependent methyltransferase